MQTTKSPSDPVSEYFAEMAHPVVTKRQARRRRELAERIWLALIQCRDLPMPPTYHDAQVGMRVIEKALEADDAAR